jgi:hypothetical protein
MDNQTELALYRAQREFPRGDFELAAELGAGSPEMVQESGRVLEAEVGEALGDCAYGDGRTGSDFVRPASSSEPRSRCRGTTASTSRRASSRSTWRPTPAPVPRGRRPATFVRLAGAMGGLGARFARRHSSSRGDRSRGRVVHRHPQEALLQQAREWQQSPEFDRLRKQRQVVEHRIARMMQLGMRQARYCGRHKTLFQALMTAAVANLTLIAGRVGLPPATDTSTAALTAVAAMAGLFRRLLGPSPPCYAAPPAS